jgi:hypothetical protein
MSVGVVGRHWAVAVSRVLLVEITRETNPDLLIASIRSELRRQTPNVER